MAFKKSSHHPGGMIATAFLIAAAVMMGSTALNGSRTQGSLFDSFNPCTYQFAQGLDICGGEQNTSPDPSGQSPTALDGMPATDGSVEPTSTTNPCYLAEFQTEEPLLYHPFNGNMENRFTNIMWAKALGDCSGWDIQVATGYGSDITYPPSNAAWNFVSLLDGTERTANELVVGYNPSQRYLNVRISPNTRPGKFVRINLYKASGLFSGGQNRNYTFRYVRPLPEFPTLSVQQGQAIEFRGFAPINTIIWIEGADGQWIEVPSDGEYAASMQPNTFVNGVNISLRGAPNAGDLTIRASSTATPGARILIFNGYERRSFMVTPAGTPSAGAPDTLIPGTEQFTFTSLTDVENPAQPQLDPTLGTPGSDGGPNDVIGDQPGVQFLPPPTAPPMDYSCASTDSTQCFIGTCEDGLVCRSEITANGQAVCACQSTVSLDSGNPLQTCDLQIIDTLGENGMNVFEDLDNATVGALLSVLQQFPDDISLGSIKDAIQCVNEEVDDVSAAEDLTPCRQRRAGHCRDNRSYNPPVCDEDYSCVRNPFTDSNCYCIQR